MAQARSGRDLLHDGELVGGNDRGKRSVRCPRIRARKHTKGRRAGREAEQRLQEYQDDEDDRGKAEHEKPNAFDGKSKQVASEQDLGRG